MTSFSAFLELLRAISDHRRQEGKFYELPYVLLFSILAIVTGTDSYRGIHTFMKTHRVRLNEAFGLSWRRAPVHSAIRYILQGLDPQAVEAAFRKHAQLLEAAKPRGEGADAEPQQAKQGVIAIDGKTLRRSFDNLNDRRAAQILNAFATESSLILAHIEIDDKSNEIPAAQKLLSELKLEGKIVTLDAMHCQKNLRSRRRGQRSFDRSTEGQPARAV